MRVILVYDIDTKDDKGKKTLVKVKKIARKYLHHIQKSVFEGYLTRSKILKLEKEILQEIDQEKDSVIIYILPESINIERKILTKIKDPLDTII